MKRFFWKNPAMRRSVMACAVLSACFMQSMYADMPVVLGNGLLDNFNAPIRSNAGTLIWSPYNGIDSGNQAGGLVNGMYQLQGFTSSGDGYINYFQFLPYPYVAPTGFAQSWILSGTTDPNANRLRFIAKCDKNMPRSDGGNPSVDLGTYVKERTDTQPAYQGQHYYHQMDPSWYAGRWMLFEFNRHPSHRVGDSPSNDYPEDPEWVNPTTGSPVHYFNGLTRFYFALYPSSIPSLPVTCQIDDVYFDTDATGSPDTLVSSVTATHTGSAYEVTWNGPKNVNQQYTVHYSTKSMKVNGFNSGTNGGTVSNPGNDYVSTIWKSPAMAEQADFYIAIQPSGQSSFTEIHLPALNSSPTAPPPTSANACDVNKDGVVNDTDVSLETSAVLGASACQADLDGNGTCNIIDLQRVINASLGQACRTGN